MKSKKIAVSVAMAVTVAILGCAVVLFGMMRLHAGTKAASVNGAEITAGEIKLRINALKADAVSHFEEEYGEDDSESGFWDKWFGDETPSQYLRGRALESAARIKLEQQLALQYGLTDDISYSAMLKKMSQTNSQNEAAIADGQPVYGQKSYNETTFFEYTLSNMRLSLQKKMSEKGGELYADNEKLKSYYNSIRDEYYKKADNISFYLLTADASEQSQLEGATALFLSGGSDKISERFPAVKLEKIELNNDNSSDYSKRNRNIYEKVSTLGAGEQSGVIIDENGAHTAVVTARSSGGYKPFTEIYDALKAQYAAEQYELYIDALAEKYIPQSESVLNKIPINEELK